MNSTQEVLAHILRREQERRNKERHAERQRRDNAWIQQMVPVLERKRELATRIPGLARRAAEARAAEEAAEQHPAVQWFHRADTIAARGNVLHTWTAFVRPWIVSGLPKNQAPPQCLYLFNDPQNIPASMRFDWPQELPLKESRNDGDPDWRKVILEYVRLRDEANRAQFEYSGAIQELNAIRRKHPELDEANASA
jgi:hypothetical protein